MMKQGIGEIVGKRISGVVVKEQPEGVYPRMQLFLMFDDDTYYEIYGHDCDIQGGSAVRSGDRRAVLNISGDSAYIVLERYLGPVGPVPAGRIA